MVLPDFIVIMNVNIVMTLIQTSSCRDTLPLVYSRNYSPTTPLPPEMVGPDFILITNVNMVVMILVMILMRTSSRGDTLPSVPSHNYSCQEIQPRYAPPPRNGWTWFHSNNQNLCRHGSDNDNCSDVDANIKLRRHTALCVFSQL